ncbi:MAG TPA: hypothetical protein ENK71_01825, partial [Epsilonproteobacteria bacterium]|nr:hypothetical protein [Campylobacterota bacterium]
VDEEIEEGVLAAMVLAFEKTKIEKVCVEVPHDDDSFEAGKKLADSFEREGLKALFVLSDGLHINGTKLSEGISEVLGSDVVVTGGLAADDNRFEHTWVLANGVLREHYICAVGFYGDAIHLAYGSGGGWQEMGPERTITKAQDNILYEIDGQPALKLYKEYLGERAEGLPATGLLFPVKLVDENLESKVRTVLGIDEEAQSIIFAGDMLPPGNKITLMMSSFINLVEGAEDAAKQLSLQERDEDHALASIAISCVGRRLVLKQHTEDELEAVMEILGQGARQIGFYSYGEISPLRSGRCDLHNQTMTLTTLWES